MNAPQPGPVAVVGLGSMGLGMAVTLRKAGWEVAGYDPDPAATSAAAEERIACVPDLDQLPGGRFVLSLPSAEVVAAVVPRLLATGRVTVIVDTTTSDPRTSREMEELCSAAGVAFVDAPVSGGRAGAWSGRLTAFVGGTEPSVAAASAVLATLTERHTHLGPAGSGNIVKLVNNLLCAANMVSVAEAVDVLAAHALDVPRALGALNTGSGRSAVSQVVFAGSILEGELNGGFAVGLMARDVALGLDVARAAGAAPTVLAATNDAWSRALDALGPRADCNLAPSTFTTATGCLSPAALGVDDHEEVTR